MDREANPPTLEDKMKTRARPEAARVRFHRELVDPNHDVHDRLRAEPGNRGAPHMLDADPLRRPRDGEEVLRALRTLDAATEGTAEQAPTQVRVRRRPSMPRAALAAATLLSVVALLAVLLTTRRHDTAPPAGSGTRSLEAYQHHLRAIELRMRDCDFVAAEREERRALALYPNFGAAHMQLGLLLLFTSDSLEDSNAHFHAAHALADRMPDRERRIILLDKYITPTMPLPGDPREHQRVAMDGFRELVERYPQDPYVLYMASFAESHFGNWDSAIDHMRRSLEADPGQCYVAYQLVGMLYRRDRGSEAIAVARRGVGVRPNAANLALLASALAVAGERDEAARYARESLGLSSSVQGRYGDWTALLALAASGYPDEAADTARRLAPRAATPFLASELQRLEALALGLQGRVREAIQRWPGDERRTRPGVDVRATLLGVGRDRLDAPDVLRRLRERPTAVLLAGELALHGDAQAGRDAAATLDPKSPPAAYHRAVALASERRWTEAVPALRAMLLRYGERTVGLPDPRVSYQLQIRLLLGEGLLETGHPEEALEALRSADPFGVSSEGAAAENLPRIWILRAHVLEQLGRLQEAVEILDRLLHQWRNADPELPLLGKARTLRERLAGETQAKAMRQRLVEKGADSAVHLDEPAGGRAALPAEAQAGSR